jgi:hypothetical protein
MDEILPTRHRSNAQIYPHEPLPIHLIRVVPLNQTAQRSSPKMGTHVRRRRQCSRQRIAGATHAGSERPQYPLLNTPSRSRSYCEHDTGGFTGDCAAMIPDHGWWRMACCGEQFRVDPPSIRSRKVTPMSGLHRGTPLQRPNGTDRPNPCGCARPLPQSSFKVTMWWSLVGVWRKDSGL